MVMAVLLYEVVTVRASFVWGLVGYGGFDKLFLIVERS